MPRLSLTTERLTLFGILLATFGELHPLCDQWLTRQMPCPPPRRLAFEGQ